MKRKRKRTDDDEPRQVAPGRVEPAALDRRQNLQQMGHLVRDVGGAVLILILLSLLAFLALSGVLRIG